MNSFLKWYQYQEKVCRYCGVSEKTCQEVIHKGLLNSKRFATEGVFARGVNRGYWLEIDRKEPNEPYSENNCVLACYFCNNDKSDVFNEKQYLEFKENRSDFLRKLILKENETLSK
ncbi:hypothetical protein [Lacihabitans soyangensis]|nr:hypothetical protein [Lacihabitans soyangensis]